MEALSDIGSERLLSGGKLGSISQEVLAGVGLWTRLWQPFQSVFRH
jgi:hypothetical protein